MSGSSFLAAAGLIEVDPAAESAPAAAPRPAATVARPRTRPPAPRPVAPRPAPRPARALATGYVVAGAHGGAGTSTVVALLDIALGPGAGAEPAALGALIAARRRALLLVARSHAYGLRAAADRLPALAHHRPVLVLVADAPAGDPAAVRYRVRALEGLVAGVVRVPYLPALRAVDQASDLADHPKIRRAAASLRAELSRIHPEDGD